MKIKSIEAYNRPSDAEGPAYISVDFRVHIDGATDILDAIQLVHGKLTAAGAVPASEKGSSESYNANTAKMSEAVQRVAEKATDAPTSSRRNRRSSTPAAAETPAEPAQQPTETAAPVEGGSRRSRRATTPEPTPEQPASIADLELTKACSNAAPITGTQAVQDIITEFKVSKVQDIPQERREEFIKALQEEIELAQLEAKVGATASSN